MPQLRGTMFDGPLPSEMETTAAYGMQPQQKSILDALLVNKNIPLTPAWTEDRLKWSKEGGPAKEMLQQALTLGSFLGGRPISPNIPPRGVGVNPASQFGIPQGGKSGVVSHPGFKRPANDMDMAAPVQQPTPKPGELGGDYIQPKGQNPKSGDFDKVMAEIRKVVDEAYSSPEIQKQASKYTKRTQELIDKYAKKNAQIPSQTNKYLQQVRENPSYAASVLRNNRDIKSAGKPIKEPTKSQALMTKIMAANRNLPRDFERGMIENDLAVLKYNRDRGAVKGDENLYSNTLKQQQLQRILDLLNKGKI